MDGEGVRWVGGVEGGVDGLRAQLVFLLQGVGMGVTAALEGAGKSLYVAMEGRRLDMEEKAKPAVDVGEAVDAPAAAAAAAASS